MAQRSSSSSGSIIHSIAAEWRAASQPLSIHHSRLTASPLLVLQLGAACGRRSDNADVHAVRPGQQPDPLLHRLPIPVLAVRPPPRLPQLRHSRLVAAGRRQFRHFRVRRRRHPRRVLAAPRGRPDLRVRSPSARRYLLFSVSGLRLQLRRLRLHR